MVTYYHLGNYKKVIDYSDSIRSDRYIKTLLKTTPSADFWWEVYAALAQIKLGNTAIGLNLLGKLNVSLLKKEINQEVSHVLSEYFESKGEYKESLKHFKLYQAYKDSSNVIIQKGVVFEAEQKYSVAQKEVAIKDLETKNLQSQATMNKLLGLAILAILVAIILFLNNKRQQARRQIERQQLVDELTGMEKEMELDRIRLKTENEEAIISQRKIISKNMHDEVSGDWLAVQYHIADLKDKVKSEEALHALTDIEEDVREGYINAREFMHRLNETSSKEQYSTFSLLENLSLRFGPGSNLQIHTEVDKELEKKVTGSQNEELYKVVREAVTNCLKHSGATRVDIALYGKDHSVVIDIKDNGRGLSAKPGTGLGMTTMRERIEGLGGVLEVNFSGQGAHIHGSFPKAA
ncbi:sensor histidine kinase [Dyadobacter sp. NIV53]|uniref:sensor histidine kinase n=1 Tax=Dyadobacter sp. NIV53 TaxID=2861765 RepID=UPI001C870042|nr:ATP-binding protein [Dyadobacter sp. NIV53]